MSIRFLTFFVYILYHYFRGERTMKRVVLYPRVSTKGQAEDGYSLAFQVEKMINYCTLTELKMPVQQ